MFGVNSIGVCQFNCSASNTFSISAEALNRWESAIERGKTRTLTASWQSMAPWLSYSQSLAPARRLNPARMTLRWTACQRSSAAAAVQSRIQWWDGGCPEAAVTSQTPLSGAWACLCCSSLGSCQPFSQRCELPSSFSINSFFFGLNSPLYSVIWRQDFCLSGSCWHKSESDKNKETWAFVSNL